MSRPEHLAPADVFYNEEEAKKYVVNSRMIEIQTKMSERAIQLLNLDPAKGPQYILDIGCGSGLSGEVLTEQGHIWVGIDISAAMLGVAHEREVEGDLLCVDMGQGLPFRGNCFDAAISISALQWLCNADHKSHDPRRRLRAFFESLYRCLKKGARFVAQVYPETPQQMEMITKAAISAGFVGGLVVDFPNSTKAKKIYLVLDAGGVPQSRAAQVATANTAISQLESAAAVAASAGQAGMEDEAEEGEGDGDAEAKQPEERKTILFARPSAEDQKAVARERRKARRSKKKGSRKDKPAFKSRDWILAKKERQRKQGKQVPHDSKYTGRSRKPRF